MLRIKVFSLKELMIKSCIILIALIGICFIVTLFFNLINIETRSFASNIVEDNIKIEETFAKGEFNIDILKNELQLDNKLYKKDIIIVENDKKTDDSKEQNTEKKIDERFINSGTVKTWDRPKTFATSKTQSGKIQVGNMSIINYSNLDVDLNELSKVSEFPINDETSFLIFHTHTSEAYSEMGAATNFRTTNDDYNMVSVGKVLSDNLALKKFDVFHSTTKHDTPSYNGAYKASLQTVQNIFKEKKYDIVLDIHRDALSGNLNYRPTTEINGESAAKLMFVVGTNASVSHDRWMENLKLAVLIQNTANEMYPGLFRDLNLSKSRYNQHVCDGALIIEVGATGNTLEEAWTAMKYLSNVLEALKM